ncbi:LysR family transcriptional regulator [Gordonia sp. TBRC 11910]|uniref:LysR family transcriptional regulator n=1 Tax=Gordonia asplenii TaxID=2725283 RepID=A0A848L6Q7_9ACTN|nr:LysR family transcriptional regulator [Gordonia asplenii]NMO04685.1 LysR family transcriptional regulator [Gordonia asplenii]
MDVRTLRYFLLVAEEGSIHGGARRAMVAQPAVTVAIKKLESRLGHRVFVRSPQGVELTPAGRTLLVHARDLLRRIDEFERDAHELTSQPPTFTVGLLAGPASAGELSLPIIETFRAKRPDLDLRVRQLRFDDHFDAILDGAVDVAVVRSPFMHDDLDFSPLFDEPTVAVASVEHPFAQREEVTMDDVLGERPLEVAQAPTVWRDFWSFADYRSSTLGAINSNATTVMEYSADVLKNRTVSPMALSGWRLGGISGSNALRAMRIVDAPRSVIGVGRRAGDSRDDVLDFVTVAHDISARLVSWVPDAETVSA